MRPILLALILASCAGPGSNLRAAESAIQRCGHGAPAAYYRSKACFESTWFAYGCLTAIAVDAVVLACVVDAYIAERGSMSAPQAPNSASESLQDLPLDRAISWRADHE